MVFRVGQKVVCVDVTVGPDRILVDKNGVEWEQIGDDLDGLAKDEIYTIRAFSFCCATGQPLVHLNEIDRAVKLDEPYEPGYLPCRFRPVVSTDTGMAVLEQIRRGVENKILRPILEPA